MKAHELLAKPESWIRGNWALDVVGRAVSPDDRHAVCWCLAGALERCYPGFPQRRIVRDRLRDRIQLSIVDWNDRTVRGHAEVLQILKELDI